jgi:hypothetical protein
MIWLTGLRGNRKNRSGSSSAFPNDISGSASPITSESLAHRLSLSRVPNAAKETRRPERVNDKAADDMSCQVA